MSSNSVPCLAKWLHMDAPTGHTSREDLLIKPFQGISGVLKEQSILASACLPDMRDLSIVTCALHKTSQKTLCLMDTFTGGQHKDHICSPYTVG